MSTTQYDTIGSTYDDAIEELDDLPAGQLEEANLHAAVNDHIAGRRVLELACGSGHYSRKLLKWGAASVVGVDISPAMVEEGKARSVKEGISEEKLRFHVGDVSADLDLSGFGGPFDLVVSEWLLNYAASSKDLEGMWQTIGNNLLPGSYFVGLTNPPVTGNKEELNRALREEWAAFGSSGHVTEEVEDGFATHFILGMPDSENKVEFENYYLRSEAFTRSTRATGLFAGDLEWLPVYLPAALREAHPAGFWNPIILNPHFRMCRIRR